MRSHYLVIPLLLPLAACTTLDLTKQSNAVSTCEVHHIPMEKKTLPANTGYIGYLGEFAYAVQHDFPHYDGTRYMDLLCPPNHKVIDYVCPQCTAAFHAWEQQHPAN